MCSLIKLPNFFIDDMVFQRGKPVCIYGEGVPEMVVTVTLNSVSQSATVHPDGKWQVNLPAMKKGGPYPLSVRSGDETYTINKVWIGEVLLCMGQSNINITYQRLQKEFDFILENNSYIKYLATEDAVYSSTITDEQFDISFGIEAHGTGKVTHWQKCALETIGGYNATGYSAAYHLSKAESDLPIGIIMIAEGGSTLESNFTGGGNWNARYAPFIKYNVGAVLFYQGESNQGDYKTYPDDCARLVNQIRKEKNDSDLPFIYAQLTRCNDTWLRGYMRDAQRKMLESAMLDNKNNIGMVVTIDTDRGTGYKVCEEDDFYHPGGKWVVGQRFANLYKKLVWKQNIVTDGPLYKSYIIEENSVIITFDYINDGLVIQNVDNSYLQDFKATNDNKLCEFEIAGADKVYYPAIAEIQTDNTVKVYADEVKSPLYVKYAMNDYPINPNLASKYVEDGIVKYIPASSFVIE